MVFDAATRAVLAERSEAIGIESNNVAEYRGLIAGLVAAREVGATHVAVRMDSKLVVEQMSGRWQVKHPAMRPLHRQAGELRRAFDDVTFEWIPRALNSHADRLANEAMDRAAGIAPKAPRPAPAQPGAGSWTPPSGPTTRVMVVRHGSTEHSAERRFSGRNDLPLNDVGTAQAAALAARDLGAVDVVLSSPLRRARQTAEGIAAARGLSVQLVDDLAEVDFGVFEGLTMAEARAAQPDALEAWLASADVAPPGGESFASVARRVRRARDAFVAEFEGRSVVLVSHVTPIKTLVRLAVEAPPSALFRIHLDTASVSRIDYTGADSASLRLFNDTSHLSHLP